jgi:nucleotide-binding universal stress UspA family protein
MKQSAATSRCDCSTPSIPPIRSRRSGKGIGYRGDRRPICLHRRRIDRAPVKIEVEIVQDKPVHALTAASRSAVLICVGAAGLRNAIYGRVGSTAAAVASSAHCPVAVIRGHATSGCVLVEVDEWPTSSAALQHGVDEAQLRGVPLRVLTPVAAGGPMAQTQLDRRVAVWRRRYPDLDVQAVASQGSTLDYLAEHADSCSWSSSVPSGPTARARSSVRPVSRLCMPPSVRCLLAIDSGGCDTTD